MKNGRIETMAWLSNVIIDNSIIRYQLDERILPYIGNQYDKGGYTGYCLINAQSLNKQALRMIEYGKSIKLDVPCVFDYKMAKKEYSVTVSDKSILSVKKAKNTVIVKGKKQEQLK